VYETTRTAPHRTIHCGSPAPRRDIIYSTLSHQAVRQLAIRHYGLEPPVECVFYFRGTNDVYRLTTSEGQFALRISRSKWRSREALIGELAALGHLGAKGVDVAMPVARKDGGLITEVLAPEGLRPAVVFRWASGRSPKCDSAAHARQYGRLMARVHSALDDLPPHNALPRMDLGYLLQRPLALIGPSLAALPRISTAMERLADRVTAGLSAAQARLSDWGFCHGDVATHNARIDGDRLVLFDFDYCGSGWRLFDLACYRVEARCRGAEAQAWEPFIEGYLQLRPAAAESLRYLGLFMILRHLWHAGQWIVSSAQMGIGALPDDFLEDLVPFCERIESDLDARHSSHIGHSRTGLEP
jgi:Ser/Thr protein kinase RdoA (MazF antagonist)